MESIAESRSVNAPRPKRRSCRVIAFNPDPTLSQAVATQLTTICQPEILDRAELIKQTAWRSVWRIALSGSDSIHLKIFDDPVWNFRCWIKRILKVHPAMREWHALNSLMARGVPVVRPITLARSRRSFRWNPAKSDKTHRILLITGSVEESSKLSEAWAGAGSQNGLNADRQRQRRRLSAAVSQLWGISHDRGYAHPDGHPGNVLVSGFSGPHAVRAVFVDPASSRMPTFHRGPIEGTQVLRSLSMLNQHFSRTATRTDRLRFWRDYWVQRGRTLSPDSERRELKCFESIAALHRYSLARRRDRRLRGDGRYFAAIRTGANWQGVVALRLERRHVFPESHVPDRSVAEWSAIYAAVVDSVQSTPNLPDNIRAVKRPVQAHPGWAKRVFEHCHRLRHRDLEAPLILGFLQHKSGAADREMVFLPARSD